MAPRAEKSQLKRGRVSPSEESDPSKKPRRSERISSLGQRRYEDPAKTPVISNRQHLPSPLTNQGLTSEETSEPAHDKEATATPPVAGGHQLRAATEDPPASYVHSQGFSSPPEDTQAFPSQYAEARNAALSEEVQDEVKEGVWGYLFPLDTRYGRCIVLRKRDACALPDRVNDGSTFRRSGRRGGEAEYERPKTEGLPSGGYLIGRHPECDVVVDDLVVSNRHCLIFTEQKGGETVAVLEDLSQNGTFVNEALVGRNKRRELHEQDEIAVLGNVRFIFRYPKSRRTSAFLQQYTILEKLGKGHFAEVFLCVEKATGQRYAVKVFAKQPGMDERSKTEGLQQEIAVLMSVSHPNVLCLKDTFNERNAVYLVLELAPEGELFNYIVEKHKLTEDETRKLFRQLFEGVKYLHDRNIVHRDIKPENILMVDKDLHVKLADFGLAKIIGEESFTTTLCGTPSYVAPEILADSRHRKYTKAVDIWSLGVVLYICLCGFPPFSEELYSKDFPFTLSQQIKSGRFDYPSPYWDSVGDPALDLIDSMLVVDVNRRFTIDQCLAHPWMTADQPGVNDSTDGLVGGLHNLDVKRRAPATRERTLLSSINEVHVKTIQKGRDGAADVKVWSKHPKKYAPAQTYQKEAGPSHNRQPAEFMKMGGKGDQQLFDSDSNSTYMNKADIAREKDKPSGSKGGKSGGGKGKGKDKANGGR